VTEDVALMREYLKDPRHRLWTALHEAGHEEYARRAGAIDIKYRGPGEYPGRPGEFGFAGIVPVFPESGVHMDLRTMARWYCAGAIMQKVLAPDSWDDDVDLTDYSIFAEESVKLSGGQAAKSDISETWKAAQQDVERDLRNPAFRREMWDLAREVESKIPW
jgi:hypothetical protein